MTNTKRLAIAECVLYGSGMHKPNSFRETIEAWGGIGPFAEDIGVPYVSAQGMWRRNSVAAWYWPKMLQVAAGKNILLTADRLVAMKPERQTKAKADTEGAVA
jgi:hypothetical protein